MATVHDLIQSAVLARLSGEAAEFCDQSRQEIRAGVTDARFAVLFSKASRYAPRAAWNPTSSELASAAELLPGWSPARWSMLDALRVLLVLSRQDLAQASGEKALEEAFRYADEGESCALFRAIPLCPSPERFVWRMSDGCRTNMTTVFEAIAWGSPYPVKYFDDVAWQQLVIKAIFMGVPLYPIHGLDGRLSADLARMALDLADERRSAGRDVQTDVWLTLGAHAGARGLESMELELRSNNTAGRCAAALALARAGETPRLTELAGSESEPQVAETMQRALRGDHSQTAFQQLALTLQPSGNN